jgi:hypothetical protein
MVFKFCHIIHLPKCSFLSYEDNLVSYKGSSQKFTVALKCFAALKVLSSEMDPAEIRLNR